VGLGDHVQEGEPLKENTMQKKVRIIADGEDIGIGATIVFTIKTGTTRKWSEKLVTKCVDKLVREIADMSATPIFKVGVD